VSRIELPIAAILTERYPGRKKIGIEKTDKVPVSLAKYILNSVKNYGPDTMNHIQSELKILLDRLERIAIRRTKGPRKNNFTFYAS
jgi:hypothetical protein